MHMRSLRLRESMLDFKKFHRAQKLLNIEFKKVEWQLQNVLDNPQIKNSTNVIELQIERLKLLDQLKYLRPDNKADLDYREDVLCSFPDWAMENIPDSMRLVFHATTLANTERILNSGKIISGKDRWSIHTSSDDVDEISVTTKDSLLISIAGYMDMPTFNLPAGCLLVLKTNRFEYEKAQKESRIHNVFFRKNPKQLYAVVTTPENINRVKWWMKKNNLSPDKAIDFNGFKEKTQEENIFFYFLQNNQNKELE